MEGAFRNKAEAAAGTCLRVEEDGGQAVIAVMWVSTAKAHKVARVGIVNSGAVVSIGRAGLHVRGNADGTDQEVSLGIEDAV